MFNFEKIKMNLKIFHVLTAVLISFNNSFFAQVDNEAKTLFGMPNGIRTENIGCFFAPGYALSSLDGSDASFFNLRGGINFNDKVSFGGYYSTSLNQINPESETVQDVYMDYWSVGGFAEYTLFAKRMVHLTFPLYIGMGEVQMDNEIGETGLGEANFFQIEPSGILEINLHKYVRFNIGVGYRFVGKMEYRNFNQSDISGLTGHVGFKIGVFK